MRNPHPAMAALLVANLLLASVMTSVAVGDDAGTARAPVAHAPLDFLWVVKSWDLPPGQEITALAMSPDGAHIAAGGNGVVALFDRQTGKEIWRALEPERPVPALGVASLHFSPDARQLIVARGSARPGRKGIAIFDAATGTIVREFTGSKYGTRDAVLSPDGKLILYHGGSGYTRAGAHADLMDAATGDWINEPDDDSNGKGRWTEAVAFMPDGKHYLCALFQSVRMHETRSGKLVKELDGVNARAVAVSPDGNRAVLCGDDGLTVWNIPDNTRKTIVTGQPIAGAAFTGDDVCVTWGVELRMWNVRTGEEISWSGTYEMNIAVAAVGGNFIVGGKGRHLQVWGLPGIGVAPAGAQPLVGRAPAEGLRPAPPLVIAAERGDAARVAALLMRGADVNAMRGLADRTGTTALHAARDYATVKALVDGGADVNAQSAQDWNRTPLHYAIERSADPDSMKIIALLLDKGAKIEATYGYNETPLQTAAKAGNRELAAYLVSRGADYDIFSAAALGDVDRIRALLKDHPELARQRAVPTKRNALYWARSKQVIDVLLEAGAETDIHDAWDATPAKDLRGNRHEDLADYLESKIRK